MSNIKKVKIIAKTTLGAEIYNCIKDALKLILSINVGKTNITSLGGGGATVKFRDINDTKDRVTATMANSERTNVSTDLT